MKHFHDLSFVATWVGKKRWADTQEPVVNSTVGVQSAGKRSSCPSIWLNRAPRRHTDERRYRWHKYSLPRSASRPSRSIPDTHCTVGSVGPRARLDTWGEKSPDPFSRWSNLFASHYIYWAIPNPKIRNMRHRTQLSRALLIGQIIMQNKRIITHPSKTFQIRNGFFTSRVQPQ